MIGTTTSCECVLCRPQRYETLKGSEFNPPQVPAARLPALGVLLKARMLALIQAEFDRQPSSASVEDCWNGLTAWNVLCRLREAVERMEIPA